MLRVQHFELIPSSPAAAPIYPARLVWYRVLTCAACPASGRVCRCAACCGRSALHLARPALCSPSGCAGGLGLHRRGIWGEPGVGQVSPVFSDQNKKGVSFTNTHPTFTKRNPSDCASLQKFQKIQKGPYWHLDCGIIG